jgi:hypothetical protein
MTIATDEDKRRQIAEADQAKPRLDIAEAVTFTIAAYSRMRGRPQPDTTLAVLRIVLSEMSDVPIVEALQGYPRSESMLWRGSRRKASSRS